MLGNTAKSRLRHLFIEISKYEKQIEVLRQVLGEQPDFEPYAAFRRLDRKRKGYITENDLSEFLQSHDYKFNEDDCTKFVNRYDADRDARLSYNEFLRTVLPLDQPDLRAIVTQRKVYDVQYNENLAYEVEYALARLLSSEMAFWVDLEELKIDLVEDQAFSFPEAFAAIDYYSAGSIDIESLRRFLTRDNLIPTEETLVCFLRRCDQDDDGKISYEDFVDALKPQTPEVDKLTTAKLRPSVLTREKFESLRAEEHSARTLLPKSTSVFTSPLKFTSPGATKVRAENFASPKAYRASTGSLIKNSASKVQNYISPRKSSGGLKSNSKRDILEQAQNDDLSQTVREKDWIKDFMRIIREIINAERELELIKQDLTLQKDFNLFDFFRIFDKTGSGSITVGEVEEGLSVLDIYPSREDLYLFIRRFDRDADGRLSDFSEAFSPYQPEYFKMLKSRTPVNSDLYFEPIQIFSKTTFKLVKQVFMTHFENETIVEALRQKNERSPHYNLRKVFEYIDSDDDGYISVFDLMKAMNKNKNFITEKEISFLFNRFDKDKDEMLSFVEFAQELTPKSHKKY